MSEERSVTRTRERRGQACAECKSKKIRCLPREGSNVCQRCYQYNTECFIPESRRPKRQTRHIRNRMDQLEQSLTSIMGILATATPGVAAQDTPGISHPTPISSARLSVAASQSSETSDDTSRESIHSVSQELLLESLAYYRSIGGSFACVQIADPVDVRSFRQERPFLLLAIIVVTRWRHRTDQTRLEQEFLKDMGERFFVKGEKSMDLIQGLLVYLSWYHFFTPQPSQQGFRLASLAANLVIELGLHKKPQCSSQHDAIVGVTQSSISGGLSEFWKREAQRALIGTYLACTLSAVLFRKANPLQYTEWLEQCAVSLAEESTYPSDKVLVHFVRLMHINEQVYDNLHHGDWGTGDTTNDEKIKLLVDAIERQLKGWKSKLPPELKDHYELGVWHNLIDAYTHEVGLYGSLQGQPISMTRVAILFDCLTAVRRYMTTIMSLTTSDMSLWTALKWRQLDYIVKLGSRITHVLYSNTFTEDSVSRMIKYESSLDQLCSRTRAILQWTNTPQGEPHYFARLLDQWETIKASFRTSIDKSAMQDQQPQQSLGTAISADMPAMGQQLSLEGDYTYLDTWSNAEFWLDSLN
ncbi:hypothetical protein BU16DRAFT_555293 [Lophium mytilinum]|uniref:Zn(2)-C6 fungal-type domain-containing protein n=1 Tax=Lophium mytilinum TaxID=390894 RepID=A0A6A6RFT5_9PEZI|nr:hypothetical protein BU16DRAFT_555293 [Lophium mytilinum]